MHSHFIDDYFYLANRVLFMHTRKRTQSDIDKNYRWIKENDVILNN